MPVALAVKVELAVNRPLPCLPSRARSLQPDLAVELAAQLQSRDFQCDDCGE